jgi:hypothetical protein
MLGIRTCFTYAALQGVLIRAFIHRLRFESGAVLVVQTLTRCGTTCAPRPTRRSIFVVTSSIVLALSCLR